MSVNTKIPNQQADPSQEWLGYLLGLIGVLIFAGTLPATRFVIDTFDPWFITFGRAVIASLAAILILLAVRRRLPTDRALRFFWIGILLVYGFPGFVALAMTSVPSSHGAVILGILPLATAMFAALWAGERPSPLFWVCGIVGAVLIAAFAIDDSGWSLVAGDFWLVAAGLSAAAGYVLSGKLTAEMPGWEVICRALVWTAPISLALSIWLWDSTYLAADTGEFIAFSYLGLGSMLLGFFAWNAGLQLGGISKVGQLQLLQTFFTLGISAVLLDETITAFMVLFAVAILIVVLIGKRASVTRTAVPIKPDSAIARATANEKKKD